MKRKTTILSIFSIAFILQIQIVFSQNNSIFTDINATLKHNDFNHIDEINQLQDINSAFPAYDQLENYRPTKNDQFFERLKNGDESYYYFDSAILYNDEGERWKESSRRNPEGKTTLREGLIWNENNYEWARRWQQAYTYFEYGELQAKIYQTWDTVQDAWRNESNTKYEYGDSGEWQTRKIQYWSDQDSVWKNNTFNTLNYTESGDLLSNLTQGWSQSANDWINNSITIVEYDSVGNWLSWTHRIWDIENNIWEDDDIRSYTYNELGENVFFMKRTWNKETLEWENDHNSTYTYDENGNQIISVSQDGNDTTNIWVNVRKITREYDDNGNETHSLQYSWDTLNNEWNLNFQHSITWDNSGNMLTNLTQTYDSNTNIWMNSRFYDCTYDDSGNILSALTQIGLGENDWINSSKKEFQYDYEKREINTMQFVWEDTWVQTNGSFSIVLFGQYIYGKSDFYKTDVFYSSYTSGLNEYVSENENVFHIFPNPAKGKVNFVIKSTSLDSGSLIIYNQQGSLQIESQITNLFPGENSLSVDVSTLQSGIYIVKFQDKYSTQVQKLVISR